MGFTKLGNRSDGLISGRDDGSSVSTFGELNVVEMTPVAQGDFVHNINDQTFNSRSFSGGTVTSGVKKK